MKVWKGNNKTSFKDRKHADWSNLDSLKGNTERQSRESNENAQIQWQTGGSKVNKFISKINATYCKWKKELD